MASQTEAPDDLIAELARLMADETKPQPTPQPESPKAPTLRIPGDPIPVAPVRPPVEPTPSFASTAPQPVAPASAAPVTPQAAAPAAPRPFRIPGDEPVTSGQPAPFRFDFDANLAQKPAVGPASSIADRAPPVRTEPVMSAPPVRTEPVMSAPPAAPMFERREPASVAPPAPESKPAAVAAQEQFEQPAELDGDSLADLIAAELASEMAPSAPVVEEPAPEPEPVFEAAPMVEAAASAREPDNFGVAPIFGVGTTTHVEVEERPDTDALQEALDEAVLEEIPAPQDPNDPLAQMERLVGPAVHLGQGAGPLRTRATPTLPDAPPATEPASARPPRLNPDSVDEAILAAAAATGARVEWVADEDNAAAPSAELRAALRAPRPAFGLARSVAGPLVAVGLLLVAGGALYWLLGQGGAPSGPAPLITADASAVKETPPPAETAPEQSVVFNEISGVDTGAQEQIVSRDQTELETVRDIASAGNIATDGQGGVTDPNQAGLVNRKVRTVTVRPDGTIVTGDDSVAGTAMLPVDRPNVPDVPGADFSTPELIASANAETETSAPTAAPATPAPAMPVVEAGSNVPVVDAAGAALNGRSVTIPRDRPANFQQLAAAALANPAPAPTPAAPAPTAPAAEAAAQPAAGAPASNAAAYVQLASQRSEEAARSTAQQIATRYGVLFNGANLEIHLVDLGERGIYYRVLVPADSRSSANTLCTNVKAAGGDCFVL